MADHPTSNITLPQRRLKLDTLVRLRWLAVVGQTASLLVVHVGLGYPLPAGAAFAMVALSAWLNIFLKIRWPSAKRLSERAAGLQLSYDILQMSGLLFLTGGLGNPFAFLLMAPVMVSAAGLSARYTILLGVLATLSATILAFFHLPLPWPVGDDFTLPVVYSVGIWIALVSTLGFMAIYAFRVAEEARQLADALAATELVLAREQHLNALDGLATAAAHELGTPLATIYLVAKELTDEFDTSDHRGEDVALIRSQAERCREILQKLTSLSSEEDQTYQRMPVSQLLEDVIDPHRGMGVAIHSTGEGQGKEPVGTRNAAIRYGLGNLVENAVDFAKYRVDVSATWDETNLSISIRDDGPGFSVDILGKIGDPYVSVRGRAPDSETGGGLGLGIFIAKTLLERTGAKLSLENQAPPNSGAHIRVSWPRQAFEGTDGVDETSISSHNDRK
ncbi:MAG: ActS/PrrB/RegB family redox-sensitive histidine kinase [Roseibium sp.]|uniref:ActS/PrrB/RegB family redox-sensitive histidine kinase n=1 Tax=Roseibium sp. TaxID=1936156 RepID=UPI001B26EE7A|nr:ActS/PrrB/RegB family redox-sensitive histidine kinase [Roseibium sp.]MBO6894490.1 ActS/PrrB/RegB family redox-sensitive histidine kinase [Roseibium sp.]MBO6932273.1 ActS/PrrB/RegB family redox-sensitive histidine kinase [Roseibium sp.]